MLGSIPSGPLRPALPPRTSRTSCPASIGFASRTACCSSRDSGRRSGRSTETAMPLICTGSTARSTSIEVASPGSTRSSRSTGTCPIADTRSVTEPGLTEIRNRPRSSVVTRVPVPTTSTSAAWIGCRSSPPSTRPNSCPASWAWTGDGAHPTPRSTVINVRIRFIVVPRSGRHVVGHVCLDPGRNGTTTSAKGGRDRAHANGKICSVRRRSDERRRVGERMKERADRGSRCRSPGRLEGDRVRIGDGHVGLDRASGFDRAGLLTVRRAVAGLDCDALRPGRSDDRRRYDRRRGAWTRRSCRDARRDGHTPGFRLPRRGWKRGRRRRGSSP